MLGVFVAAAARANDGRRRARRRRCRHHLDYPPRVASWSPSDQFHQLQMNGCVNIRMKKLEGGGGGGEREGNEGKKLNYVWRRCGDPRRRLPIRRRSRWIGYLRNNRDRRIQIPATIHHQERCCCDWVTIRTSCWMLPISSGGCWILRLLRLLRHCRLRRVFYLFVKSCSVEDRCLRVGLIQVERASGRWWTNCTPNGNKWKWHVSRAD